MKSVFVWPYPMPTDELGYGAHIGTGSLAPLCGIDTLWWGIDERPPTAIEDYDCVFVNLFADMPHITQLKTLYPNKTVIAIPDSYMDEVFLNRNLAEETNYLAQLQSADMIGTVSESNRQFYSVFAKPMLSIPMPIGTDEYFADVRAREHKSHIMITQDHGARMVDCTIQNVAACALIQRETGLDCVYVNPSAHTRLYAEKLGLKAEFLEKTIYAEYVNLAARAKIGVDMYARHGYGRNLLTLAYAGTPAVGSRWNDFNLDGAFCDDKASIDPWKTLDVMEAYAEIQRNYDSVQYYGIKHVAANNEFDVCRKRMSYLLAKVSEWRITYAG